jgi:hypothetical protein
VHGYEFQHAGAGVCRDELLEYFEEADCTVEKSSNLLSFVNELSVKNT